MASRRFTSLPFIEKPVASGNFSASGRRPIKNVVWHTTDGTLAGTLAWFNNSAAGVSSTYVIATNGQLYGLLEEYYVRGVPQAEMALRRESSLKGLAMRLSRLRRRMRDFILEGLRRG